MDPQLDQALTPEPTWDPMDDVSERRRQALRRICRERFDGNQAELARAIGRSPATVWRLLTEGAHEKPLGEKLAREIEHALKIPEYALDGVAQSVRSITKPDVRAAHKPWAAINPVPLLTAEQVITVVLQKQDLPAPEEGSQVHGNEDASERAFAMEVRGKAMAPEFLEGDHVVVDPALRPESGDVVVAIVADRDVVLRRYRPYTELEFELSPVNNHFGAMNSLAAPLMVVGVVIEHRRKRDTLRRPPAA